AQLDELRAMLAAARDVDVPEPSPLFWDHLSARVSEAVAAEESDARLKPSRYLGISRDVAWGALAAGVLIAVAIGTRALAPGPMAPPSMTIVSPEVAGAEPAVERFSDWAPE